MTAYVQSTIENEPLIQVKEALLPAESNERNKDNVPDDSTKNKKRIKRKSEHSLFATEDEEAGNVCKVYIYNLIY